MTAPRISDADLDWLACRYVLNELSGAELDTFEQLLASSDDRVCTAVVEAVMLVEGVVQVERSDIGVHLPLVQAGPDRISRRVVATVVSCAAIVACSAAALVLAVGGLSFYETPSVQQGTDSATTVAALWIEGADADEDQSLDRVLLVNREQVDLDDEDAVPGWLLAAVTEQHRMEDGEEMMQD